MPTVFRLAGVVYFLVSALVVTRTFLVYPEREQAWLFAILWSPVWYGIVLFWLARAYGRKAAALWAPALWRLGLLFLVFGALGIVLTARRKFTPLVTSVGAFGPVLGGAAMLLVAWKAKAPPAEAQAHDEQ